MKKTDKKTSVALPDSALRDLFQASPVGRLVVSAAKGFPFVEVNAAGARLFDVSREEMLGKKPGDLFDAAVAEQILQALESCLKSKKPVTVNILPRTLAGVRMQAFILSPVFGPKKSLKFIDITARPDLADGAQLQRERDDAIQLLTSLFDAGGIGIIVTDHHGRIVRMNDTFLADYGWTREDLLGEEFTVIIPPENHAETRKLHAAFIERGRRGSREVRILKKGGIVAESVVTTAMLELSQKRRFMVATIRDVTERKNMMRSLQRAKDEADSASRAKSSFLANMSHELRTPLNAIIGFSELMKHQTFGPIQNPKYEEYLGDIHFSARHLLDIINDVLDMSKIEAGKVELAESDVALEGVFESVRRIMLDRALAGKVKISFDAGKKPPRLRADMRLLRQILINLVANAVKFSPPGKAVKVTAQKSPRGGLRVSVIDEGSGIPADRLRQVLEPFGQINDPRQQYKRQGTGLGLPLARAMTELHGGTLTLNSEEGRGTSVHLDFPADRVLP